MSAPAGVFSEPAAKRVKLEDGGFAAVKPEEDDMVSIEMEPEMAEGGPDEAAAGKHSVFDPLISVTIAPLQSEAAGLRCTSLGLSGQSVLSLCVCLRVCVVCVSQGVCVLKCVVCAGAESDEEWEDI